MPTKEEEDRGIQPVMVPEAPLQSPKEAAGLPDLATVEVQAESGREANPSSGQVANVLVGQQADGSDKAQPDDQTNTMIDAAEATTLGPRDGNSLTTPVGVTIAGKRGPG